MSKNVISFLLALLCVGGLSSFILQDDPITQLLKKLDDFTKKYPQEKIHLHLDKPYYAIGDDIWFNAYVVNTKTGEPTHISNVIYVELINERDSISKLLKLPMKGGIAWGDFKLADTLIEGNYRIRAYTQWMRNAGSEFFYDKVIKIGNSWSNSIITNTTTQQNNEGITHKILFKSKSNTSYANCEVSYVIQLGDKKNGIGKGITDANGEIKILTPPNTNQQGRIIATITLPDKKKVVKTIPIKTKTFEADLQFFPEGGNLIDGLPSKIAVKSINNNGLGENVKLTIYDNEKIEILNFETTYLGMGSFFFTPMTGKTYQAKAKFANGLEKIFDLPKSAASGYVVTVNNIDTTKMSVKVMLSLDLLNMGDLTLVAQRNGNIYSTTEIPDNKQITTVILPKKEIPSGIAQITLFNHQNIPVAERIAFVNNSTDKINLDIQDLKSAYAKRENVTLNLFANNNFKPVQGSFSVAVTNADIVKPDVETESNILTGLLLTSDLVGYVEKPNYYFLRDDAETRQELDNLILTQGWRKINWKEIAEEKNLDAKYPAEKGLTITGNVTTNNNKPILKGKIALMSSSKRMFVTTTETDERGYFVFDEMSFGDSLKFVVQASTKEDKKNIKIKLNNIPNQDATLNKNAGDVELNVNTSLVKYLQESDRFFDEQFKSGFLTRTNLLKTVTITQKKAKKEDSASVYSANYNGRGNADRIITANDLRTTYSLAQYIAQGRVLGVADSAGYAYNARIGAIEPPKDPFEMPPVAKLTVVIDGMPLQDFSLNDIAVSDIESVEVLLGPAYIAAYGATGKYGLLIISMKRGIGRKASEISTPGLIIFSPKGYDFPRQFYSPKYDVAADTKLDLRTTVYWNPQVVTDINGKANFSFYNNDQVGNYRMVIEGIDADGNLARKILHYEIK
ncbi:MAG: TonB-dependent receptor [Pedobacter sp.]|nr:MAG: TonB-dependent receptor [Pedobacter sp.]